MQSHVANYSSRQANLNAFEEETALPGMKDWPYTRQSLPFATGPDGIKLDWDEANAFHNLNSQVLRLRAKGLGDHSSSGDSGSD